MAIVRQGSTTLNAGAKGDKGDAGSGTNPNSFEASAVTLIDGANAGKVASVESVIDLGGGTVALQKGMVIQFNGGSFTNGTINWNNNIIDASNYAKIFDETNVSHIGKPAKQDVYVEWFGVIADNATYGNALAGNITLNTYGFTPFDRCVEFMRVCKGGTMVLSDTSANYLVNQQDPDDSESEVQWIMAIRYDASDTDIRIDKGVNLKGNTCDHNWFTVLGLYYVNNVTVYGGGSIEGDFDTHTGVFDNGMCIQTFGECNYITFDNIEMFNTTGDGFAAKIDTNYLSAGQISGYALGDIDDSGNLIASTSYIRSAIIDLTGGKTQTLGYTRLMAGSYGSYDGTEGKYDVYFYTAGGAYVSKQLNFWMYERLNIPATATQAYIVIHQTKITYTDSNDAEQPLRFTFQPVELTEHLVIKNCNIHHNARNGISATGTQYALVDNCYIHDMGGSTTGTVGQIILWSAIDLEDYYRGNRYWVIKNCTIQNNGQYDIPLLRPHDVKIINNTFLPSTDNRNNNDVIKLTTDSDNLIFTGNTLYGGTVFITDDNPTRGNVYSNNIYDECFIDITGGKMHHEQMRNCYMRITSDERITLSDIEFTNDLNKTNTGFQYTILSQNGVNTAKIILKNITINGGDDIRSIQLAADNQFYAWIEDNSGMGNTIISGTDYLL